MNINPLQLGVLSDWYRHYGFNPSLMHLYGYLKVLGKLNLTNRLLLGPLYLVAFSWFKRELGDDPSIATLSKLAAVLLYREIKDPTVEVDVSMVSFTVRQIELIETFVEHGVSKSKQCHLKTA